MSNEKPFDREIIKTWLTGPSCTLIIPRKLAREIGIDKPSHLLVERTPDGILLKKFEI